MPDRHALLGPSSAHRWLECTPSARLEERFPNQTSAYAEEGTKAHALCEWKLRTKLLGEKKEMPECVDDDMDMYTTLYADFVEEELNAAKAISTGATLFVEQELDFSDYVPEGFGTSDAVIVADGQLTVIDFKYGKGVPVSAQENPQLRLYALGSYLALESLYEIQTIRMVVYQPRISFITEDTITAVDLVDWASTYVKPRAEMAWNGVGSYEPGDHCKFCRAGAVCKARAEKIFPVFNHDRVLAPVLADDEIPALMEQFDACRDWMEAIEDYAQSKAINEGVRWPGFKLVEARTLRKIPNDLEACNRLVKAGYSKDEFTNVKLKGIGDLEKLVGKKNFPTLLGDLVVKPQGAPTLVKNSDKREEINPIELAFKEN